MNVSTLPVVALAILVVPIGLGLERAAGSSTPPALESMVEGEVEDRIASGTFEVTVTVAETEETPEGHTLGRSTLEKRFHGDLQGTGRGQMLTALTTEEGSAGYVAIERVFGTLHDREGAFLLQHSGLMDEGAPILTIGVIPDSGTGGLEGLTGTMTISIEAGRHHYEFRYSLDTQG